MARPKKLPRTVQAVATALERDVIELGDRDTCREYLERKGYDADYIEPLLTRIIQRARTMRAADIDLWALREFK